MIVLRSIYFWVHVVFMTLIVSLPILICSTLLLPFNRSRTWAHQIGTFWAWSIFHFDKRFKVTIEGKEHLSKQASVIISNHESLSDIIALYLLQMKVLVDQQGWI